MLVPVPSSVYMDTDPEADDIYAEAEAAAWKTYTAAMADAKATEAAARALALAEAEASDDWDAYCVALDDARWERVRAEIAAECAYSHAQGVAYVAWAEARA